MAPTAARGSSHAVPSRPLTPREATLLMLARWDTMDAVAAEPQPRGRQDARQRSSSVPNRDGARSRVRDYEQFEAERERLRLIQVETERRADEEAARKVWEGQQEDRSKRRKAERKLQLLASRQRSETPPLIRMDELEPFEWMPPSRSASVSASVASTGSQSAVSRGSGGSEDSVPYASASEESAVGTEVEAKASSRQWKWEITDGERSRGSRTGRKKPESKPRSAAQPPSTCPRPTFKPPSPTPTAIRQRPHPRHRSQSLPARARRSASPPPRRRSPSVSPAHTPRSPKDALSEDEEPPKTAVEAGLQALEQLPGAIGAGISKLLPNFFAASTSGANPSAAIEDVLNRVVKVQVGRTEELKNGQMKEVPVPGAQSSLLICKVGGQLYATSSRSTYDGTRLSLGVLSAAGIVRCRQHDAAFDVRTGAIVDGPGLAPLHTFPVIIGVETDSFGLFHISALLSKVDSLDGAALKRVRRAAEEGGTVIVGGGAAVFYLSDGLRTGGFKGGITLIERGNSLPYNRCKLSKKWLDDPSSLLLRQATYYEKLGVHVRLSTEVISADFDERFVALGDGSILSCDKLVIATGSIPRRLRIPCHDLDGILTLRSLADAEELRQAVNPSKPSRRAHRIVIIGSSFLGTELANLFTSPQLTKSKPHVTLVSRDSLPLEGLLGTRLATALLASHQAQGVTFVPSTTATAFLPSTGSREDRVGAVQLSSGEVLPADLVISALGTKGAAPGWLKRAKGVRSEEGRVEVDERGRMRGVGRRGVFAVGDVAYRRDSDTGAMIKSEHWNEAANSARTLAHYLITSSSPTLPPSISIISSHQPHPLHLLLTSSSVNWETNIILGDPSSADCVAYYAEGETIVAMAQFSPSTAEGEGDPLLAHCKMLMQEGRMLELDEVRARRNPLRRALH